MAQPELAANALMDELMEQCQRFYYQLGPFSTLSEFEKARIDRDIQIKIHDLSKLSKGLSHSAMMFHQAALGNEKKMTEEHMKSLNYVSGQSANVNYAARLNLIGHTKKAIEVLETYLESNAPTMTVIWLLSMFYRAIGLFSEDVKLMKTYSKLNTPQLDAHLPVMEALEFYLIEHEITQEETEHYFTIVNTYFNSHRIDKYIVSRDIMKDDEDESWVSTRYQIQDDLTSEQIHSMNLGLLKLLAESDISDKAFDHFITSIY